MEKTTKNQFCGSVMLLLAALLWGIAFAAQSKGMDYVGPFTFNGARSVLGVAVLLLPFGKIAAMAGLIILGVGCAPTYPCIIHATPIRFGAEKSQAFIGVQMASAYTGSTLMPPLFGLIANHISIGLYPVYLGCLLVLMAFMHERVVKATEG